MTITHDIPGAPLDLAAFFTRLTDEHHNISALKLQNKHFIRNKILILSKINKLKAVKPNCQLSVATKMSVVSCFFGYLSVLSNIFGYLSVVS